jgi:hypothetical protein
MALWLWTLALPAVASEPTRAPPSPGDASAPAAVGAATPPVTGTSLCPAPEAVWQELGTLLPRDELLARLRAHGGAGALVRIDDLGASFRVSLLDKVREYREEARDCARRTRMGALFAALVIDPTGLSPTAFLGSAPPPAVSAPAPAPPPPPAPVPVPTAPAPAVARLEVGPAGLAGLDGHSRAASLGGAVRLGVGRGAMMPVLGVAGFWPSDTSIGGIRLRQWRLPIDLSVRVTLPGGVLDLYGELGLGLAVLSERALDLLTAKSATAIEVGGRLALGARLASPHAFAPFGSLALEVVPDPPSVVALPVGLAGRTPYLWLGASAGVTWGMR